MSWISYDLTDLLLFSIPGSCLWLLILYLCFLLFWFLKVRMAFACFSSSASVPAPLLGIEASRNRGAHSSVGEHNKGKGEKVTQYIYKVMRLGDKQVGNTEHTSQE